MRNRHQGRTISPRRIVTLVLMAVVSVLAVACGTTADEAPATTPATPQQTTTSPTVTTTTTPVTTTTIAAVSTTAPERQAPVIHLSGSSTVYSPDGAVRVFGWVDAPASVAVAGDQADVGVDPYAGFSTFEVFLELEPDVHSIDVTATDEAGTQSSVSMTVVSDPTLERVPAYVLDIDPADRTVVADYVEFLTGDDATAAARADGAISDDEELPGEFYVRNRNSKLRTLVLNDPELIVLQACYPDTGPCVEGASIDLDGWIGLIDDPESSRAQYGWTWYGSGSAPYWLTIQDGVVVHVSELYLP
jgi:hypothetical protein